MRQILFIHGGDSFSSHQEYIDALKAKQLSYDQLRYSRRWREWVAEQLAEDGILTPNFPNGFNAQYDE